MPAKPYTAAITQSTTSSIKKLSAERGSLKSFQANDPKLTLVADGYPFVGGTLKRKILSSQNTFCEYLKK